MLKRPFELLLALCYLRSKRMFVSIIGVMSGLDHSLREKILGFNSHLAITQSGQTMVDYFDVAEITSMDKKCEITPSNWWMVLLPPKL